MATTKTPDKKLTKQEQAQHQHVLSVAKQNLELVINQVESMDHALYDSLLEDLDTAKQTLKGVIDGPTQTKPGTPKA